MAYLTHADLDFAPVQVEDFAELIALRNDPSTWANLTDPLPLAREKQEAWLRSTNTSRDRFYWSVRSKTEGFDFIRSTMEHYRFDDLVWCDEITTV